MNSNRIDSELLINEWQLGQQLNSAVHNGTRDKFNLLLSLLSDDARDFAQFTLVNKNEDVLETTRSLRETFHLPPEQPLVNNGISIEQASRMNHDLHNNNLRTIHLKQLLYNEAILSRQEKGEFSVDVVDNLSLVAQQRLSTLVNNQKPQLANEIGTSGVTNELMDMYRQFDLDNKPLKVSYM